MKKSTLFEFTFELKPVKPSCIKTSTNSLMTNQPQTYTLSNSTHKKSCILLQSICSKEDLPNEIFFLLERLKKYHEKMFCFVRTVSENIKQKLQQFTVLGHSAVQHKGTGFLIMTVWLSYFCKVLQIAFGFDCIENVVHFQRQCLKT